jgi:hypothetical protein
VTAGQTTWTCVGGWSDQALRFRPGSLVQELPQQLRPQREDQPGLPVHREISPCPALRPLESV